MMYGKIYIMSLKKNKNYVIIKEKGYYCNAKVF